MESPPAALSRPQRMNLNTIRLGHALGSICLLLLPALAWILDIRLFQQIPGLSETSLILLSVFMFLLVMVFALHLKNQTLKRHWIGASYDVKGVKSAYLQWWYIAGGIVLISFWPMIHYPSRLALLLLVCFSVLSCLVCPSPKMILPYHHTLSK